jgi:hypothetical protein
MKGRLSIYALVTILIIVMVAGLTYAAQSEINLTIPGMT